MPKIIQVSTYEAEGRIVTLLLYDNGELWKDTEYATWVTVITPYSSL